MSGLPPEGWDADIDPALIEGARAMRQMFLALQVAGFTSTEAAQIIGAMLAAQNAQNTRSS
ncbi:MAG: hypothetical protein ACTHMS_23625 [Jatrophihabitans sp.]|uniref:hypothetical protein n=1 Tax=Jatrophihabitans sp. TaxID=1932789 RepID=UPI003F7D6FD3